MIVEGDENVIHAIIRKKQLQLSGEQHDHIRPVLFSSGGAVKGVYGLAALLALDELGYRDTFTAIVGVSSGALSPAYFLSGQIMEALEMTRDQKLIRGFVKPFSLNEMLDIKHLHKILQGGLGIGLDYEAIRRSKTDFYVGVSNFQTSKPSLISAREGKQSLFSALEASVSMPGVITHESIINGVRYVDGESTDPYILQHAFEQLKPTHTLVIANHEKAAEDVGSAEKIMMNTFLRFRVSNELRKSSNARLKNRHKWLIEQIKSKNPTFIVWGDNSIGGMERNLEKIQNSIKKYKKKWHQLFS